MTERINELLSELIPLAMEAQTATPKRSGPVSEVMTALRPWVDFYITGTPPKAVRDVADMRLRRWLISMEFVDLRTAERIAMSEGRRYDTDGTVSAYGGDIVTGLAAAAPLIAEYAGKALGTAQHGFDAPTMQRALSNLRPAIALKNGHATMRRSSPCGTWHLICDVLREGAWPRGEGIRADGE
jgi:hypothetical protein